MAARLKAFTVYLLIGIIPLIASDGGNMLDVRYEYYTDKNKVVSQTPVISFTKLLNHFWSVSFEQEIDAVSGASRFLGSSSGFESGIDAISGATKPEIRTSENVNITYSNQGHVAGMSFYMSHEPDYQSYAPTISGSWDFNDRNTTLGGSFGHYFDNYLGRKNFPTAGKKSINSLSLSLSQSLTSRTIVSFSGNYIDSRGFLGHPYRPVTLESQELVEEKVPGQKTAVALATTIVQGYHLFDDYMGSFNINFRYFEDNWGMCSNTLDVKWYQYLTETFFIRLRYRLYDQGTDKFISAAYTADSKYRSADVRYFPFYSNLVGIKFSGAFPDSWQESSPLIPTRWNFKVDYLVRSTQENLDYYQKFYKRFYSPLDNYLGVENYYSQIDLLMGVSYEF